MRSPVRARSVVHPVRRCRSRIVSAGQKGERQHGVAVMPSSRNTSTRADSRWSCSGPDPARHSRPASAAGSTGSRRICPTSPCRASASFPAHIQIELTEAADEPRRLFRPPAFLPNELLGDAHAHAGVRFPPDLRVQSSSAFAPKIETSHAGSSIRPAFTLARTREAPRPATSARARPR